MAPNLDGPPTIIDPGGPGPLKLMFANQFKMLPTILFKWPQLKWAPNNNIDPRGPRPLNLTFAN